MNYVYQDKSTMNPGVTVLMIYNKDGLNKMNKDIGNVKEIMNQATVDSIAELRAEKARLAEIENRLMENLKMQGTGTYYGKDYGLGVVFGGNQNYFTTSDYYEDEDDL